MATYRLSVNIIGRSNGKNISAVAAAAYRAEEELQEEKNKIKFDYSKKNYCLHKEILLPSVAPEKFKNRALLWNEVEKCEKRKKSQLSKEFQLSLPHELKLEQQKELVKIFCNKELVAKGIICDIAIHNEKNRNKNFHAHVMTTTRNIEGESFGKKNRDWNTKDILLEWRKNWEKEVNMALKINNINQEVSCKSNKERGLEAPVLPTLRHKTFNLIKKINNESKKSKNSRLQGDLRGAKERQGSGGVISSNRILEYANQFAEYTRNITTKLKDRSKLRSKIGRAGQSAFERASTTYEREQREKELTKLKKQNNKPSDSRGPRL